MKMPKKKMYDQGKVFAGLAIFVVLLTFPFWFNLGGAAPAPEIKLSAKAEAAKACVEPNMTVAHMQLLDTWRDTVVRSAQRIYVNSSGKQFEMSLSNTCLDCHVEKAEFCDKCHNYAAVSPYCWDCHIDPKEAL
jgi:hypothetical protein